MTSHLAQALLAPRSVALVGVSRDATRLSGLALPYLRAAGFDGEISLVNPSIDGGIPGVRVVPDVAALADGIDLAFVAVSAERTPGIVKGLAARGTGAVVVGASGFSELGPAGALLESELASAVDASGTRLIGPNCNGLYAVQAGVALGFNRSHGRSYVPGGVAIVSQSGALIGAVADLCTSSGAGLRGFFSTGNELDVRLVDLLEILATDEETSVIALVLDRVGDPVRFRAACERARSNGKRVLAFKFGNSAAGQKASQSHSARMAGDDASYDVLFRLAGVTRCASLTELAVTAALLESRPRPTRPGALVISTSGAGGALAADALEHHGVPLVDLAEPVVEALAPTLRFVKPGNPVDVGAGGSANAIANFAALSSTADGTCTVFFYLPPPTPEFADLYSTGFAELVGGARRDATIGIAVMIDRTDSRLVDAWLAAGIPVVGSVDEAAAIVANLQEADGSSAPAHVDAFDDLVLSELDASRILSAAGIPLPASSAVGDPAGAVVAADAIGYPVVLKGVPDGLAHKSAAGLVVLDVRDAAQVASVASDLGERLSALGVATGVRLLVAEQVSTAGLDIILSAKADPEFGAVGLVGLGGTNAEALGAYRVLLPPFDTDQVRVALDGIGVLDQARLQGIESDEAVLIVADALTRVSQALKSENLASLEINPLRLQPEPTRIVALDALGIRGESS